MSEIFCSAARSSASSTASRNSSRKTSALSVMNGHAAGQDLGRHDGRAVLRGDRGDDDEDAVGGRACGGRAARRRRRRRSRRRRRRPCRPARACPAGRPWRRSRAAGRCRGMKMFSSGTPTARASSACSCRRLKSPCIGITYLRLRQVEHQLDLLLIAVAGGVDRGVGGRDDGAADAVEAVDDLVDRALVAGDRRGGEDHRVARVQLDRLVVAVGHAAQRRQRLALGPGEDDRDLLVGELVDVARLDEDALRRLDVPERAADVDVLAHRAADEARPCGRSRPRR